MKQKLINNKKYSSICENCFYGRLGAEGDRILCTEKGIMRPDSSCQKYKYDPLKRRPKRPKKMQEFTKEDFTL